MTGVQTCALPISGKYLAKVTQQNLQKHGMQHDMYGKLSKNRQKGVANAFKRLEVHPTGEPVHHLVTKEDVQLNEALSVGDEVQCNKTFRYGKVTDIEDGKVTVKYKDGSTETGESNWWTKKILDEQLYKKARFVSGAGKKPFKAPIQATPRVDESRGHKVIATFFKNREIAQKAFTGQNKPVEKPQEKKVVKESRKAEIVKDIVKKKKKEVFNPEPVLGSTQVKADTVNTTTG